MFWNEGVGDALSKSSRRAAGLLLEESVMSSLSKVPESARSPVNSIMKLAQMAFAILICVAQCVLVCVLVLDKEKGPYKWIVHRAEVELTGESAKA